MHPLYMEVLVELRQDELRRQAEARRLHASVGRGRKKAWRQSLGGRLEHWGRRLQATGPTQHRSIGPTAS